MDLAMHALTAGRALAWSSSGVDYAPMALMIVAGAALFALYRALR